MKIKIAPKCHHAHFGAIFEDKNPPLFFVHNLKDIEFQIIRGIVCPQDRMIRALLAEFHLAKPLVCIAGSLSDRLLEELRGHEV